MATNGNPRVIQSIQRAFDIIDCFNSQQEELALGEISAMLGLHKSTVHGILNTMAANGYISQNSANDKYQLGKKFISKSLIVPQSALLLRLGEKYLTQVTSRHGVTSHFMYCERNNVYPLKMVFPTTSYYVISSVVGRRMPLHATASGKVVLSAMEPDELNLFLRRNPLAAFTEHTITDPCRLLAELEKIRETGYSLEDEEIEKGTFSIACPIYNQYRKVFATISISAYFLSLSARDAIIAELKDASRALSDEFIN